MIRIKTLNFSNMFSYGKDVPINFDSRVTQLVGKNGSGKSSIPAILEDLFYNKTSRGVKKKSIKNRYVGDNFYESSCEFSIGEDEYLISKKVTSKTELSLIKNGTEDLSGHTTTQTYDVVKSLLGMDFSTFTKLVYQSMLSNLDFLEATDGNRKKFLVSLLGLESYTEYADRVKKALSEVKKEISSREASIKALESNKPASIGKLKDFIPEMDENRIIELQKEIDDIKDQNYEIRLKNEKIASNNKAITRFAQLPGVAKPEEVTFDYDVKAVRNRLSEQLAVKESELKTLKQPATKCPTCGTPYNNEDHVEHINNKKKELESTIVEIKRDLEEATLDHARLAQYETDWQKYKQYENLRAELEKAIDKSLETELLSIKPTEKLESELYSLRLDLQKAKEHNSSVKEHNARVRTMKEQAEKTEKSIAQEQSILVGLKARKERLSVLNDAFGTKGLISYKIESMTKTFEGLINEYLTIFSDGRFNLIFQVEDTKLALKLFDNGEEIEMASLSSGEFNKVNTSTLLAIRKMMVAVSKININLLFLDEVVSVLDEESKDTLINVLLEEKDLNSVVVSHGYSHPLTNTIRIKNTDGISEVIDGE